MNIEKDKTEDGIHEPIQSSDSSEKQTVDEDNTNEIGEQESNLGNPTYEELFDKREELENLLLRASADLDNAYKRTLSEVEKAHKYGTERLLTELLPIIDNLEDSPVYKYTSSNLLDYKIFDNQRKLTNKRMSIENTNYYRRLFNWESFIDGVNQKLNIK